MNDAEVASTKDSGKRRRITLIACGLAVQAAPTILLVGPHVVYAITAIGLGQFRLTPEHHGWRDPIGLINAVEWMMVVAFFSTPLTLIAAVVMALASMPRREERHGRRASIVIAGAMPAATWVAVVVVYQFDPSGVIGWWID